MSQKTDHAVVKVTNHLFEETYPRSMYCTRIYEPNGGSKFLEVDKISVVEKILFVTKEIVPCTFVCIPEEHLEPKCDKLNEACDGTLFSDAPKENLLLLRTFDLSLIYYRRKKNTSMKRIVLKRMIPYSNTQFPNAPKCCEEGTYCYKYDLTQYYCVSGKKKIYIYIYIYPRATHGNLYE